MSTIGVILVGYDTEDLLPRCLAPWVEARASKLDGNSFLICAVNTPFDGFPNEGQDSTRVILNEALNHGDIDHLIVSDVPMKETEARTQALTWLKERDVEVVIQVDSDEWFEVLQISRVFRFVGANPWIVWFKLSYKNFIFDEKTYLVEPFVPSRIHRIRPKVGVLSFEAYSFVQDNDICYSGGLTRDVKRQEQFASMIIPAEVVWIRHFAWLSNSRSRKKCEYQLARWGLCSYHWDYENDKLCFALGIPFPEIAQE